MARWMIMAMVAGLSLAGCVGTMGAPPFEEEAPGQLEDPADDPGPESPSPGEADPTPEDPRAEPEDPTPDPGELPDPPADPGDEPPEDPPPLGCAALAAPSGAVVEVSTVDALHEAVQSAASGTTILVADGTYEIWDSLWLSRPGLTLRGRSGDRDRVVIDAGPNWVGEAVVVSEDDVTVADLTIRNADNHCIHIWGYYGDGVDRVRVYNVALLDATEQLLKVSTDFSGTMTTDGEVACSYFGYTTTAPSDYTNGVDVHAGVDWVIRDNRFERVRGPGGGYAGPAILVWSASRGTIVERNVLVDCYRGVAFGNPSHGSGDHLGGVIRNNFIVRSMRGDVGIELANATGAVVAHNTILLMGEHDTSASIDAYGESDGLVAYNLTNLPLQLDRGGAWTTGRGNVTDASPSWVVDPARGDLHLNPGAAGPAVDAGAPLDEVPEDIDGAPRGSSPDVGADER